MGVYGCMRFAHKNGLVVRQEPSDGHDRNLVPVAVDLWNVMYGLMEKYYPKHERVDDDATATLRCLLSLLRLLHKKKYFPFFVFDGGIDGEVKAAVGAKALVAKSAKSLCLTYACNKTPISLCAQDSLKPSPELICNDGTSLVSRCDFSRYLSQTCADEDDGLRISSTSSISHDGEGTVMGELCQHVVMGGEVVVDDKNIDALIPAVSVAEQCIPQRSLATRWSSKPETPRVSYKLCVSVIRHLGYAYVEAATAEADDVCANLYHTKTVSYVVSSDTDLLLMGCDIIVDITPPAPSVIRCYDILSFLGMDYPTFLAKFVRCHTDLHSEPTLKSMQEVIDMITMENPGSDDADTHQPDDDGFVLVVKCRGKRKTGNGPCQTISEEDHREQSRNGKRARKTRCQNRTRVAIAAHGASAALDRLPPARTLCDVLEREFIKHVAWITTPERLNSRLSILKRIPIAQESRNEDALRSAIMYAMSDPWLANTISDAACERTPHILSYRKVLFDYWERKPVD
nr:tegument host shutoff protein UL41 [Psittacid alphaherpesvirus 6]